MASLAPQRAPCMSAPILRCFLPNASFYRTQFGPPKPLLMRQLRMSFSTIKGNGCIPQCPRPLILRRSSRSSLYVRVEQSRSFIVSPVRKDNNPGDSRSDDHHFIQAHSPKPKPATSPQIPVAESITAQITSYLHYLKTTPTRNIVRDTNWRWIFQLSGGYVQQHNFKSWLKFHGVLLFKVMFWMAVLWNLLMMFVWAAFHLYYEIHYPTPKCFTDGTRQRLHWLSFYRDYKQEPHEASQAAKKVVEEMDKEMKTKGGWEQMSDEWRRESCALFVRFGDMLLKISQEREAAGLYMRALGGLLSDGKSYVLDDVYTRAEAFIGLGNCLTGKDETSVALAKNAYVTAIELAADGCGVKLDPQNPRLSPNGPTPSPMLVSAIMALAVHTTATSGPAAALPIFASLSRGLPEGWDPCTEAKIMAYLGEILYALKKTGEGLSWTMKALDKSEAEARSRQTCVDCAHYAVDNALAMMKEIGGDSEETRLELSNLRRRKRLLSRFGFK